MSQFPTGFSGQQLNRKETPGFGSGNRGRRNAVRRIVRGGGARKRRKDRFEKRLGSDPLQELGSFPKVPAIDPMMLIRKRPSRGRR